MSKLRRHAFLLVASVTFVFVFVVGFMLAQFGSFHVARQLRGVLDVDSPLSDDATSVTFAVQPGESATAIGQRLEESGLIQSALAFRLMARSNGVESRLAAGEYELRPNMRPSDILQVLAAKPADLAVKVVFPEGWRIEEMADRLEASGVLSRTEFLQSARQGNVLYSFLDGRHGDSSLEGYLFPDTYLFAKNVPVSKVLDSMLSNFDRRFDTSMRQQAERQGLSLPQVVTIASIVEREAVVPEERPMIAEVFLNRMALRMPLQADPTVQYAVALLHPEVAREQGYWKSELTAQDLQVDSPYNTYRYQGLPPGPIANPGLASLKAVLAPTSTGYLYFVAKSAGAHAFARTLSEHNENVAQYRRLSRAR